MKPLPPFSTLGPLEQRVMEVLWKQAPQDVSVVQQALGGQSAYSTVKTILERLSKKGWLTRQKIGKAYRYQPTISRTQSQAEQARALSQALLTGLGGAALTHFVEIVSEDPAQLEELRRLLSELEAREPEEAG